MFNIQEHRGDDPVHYNECSRKPDSVGEEADLTGVYCTVRAMMMMMCVNVRICTAAVKTLVCASLTAQDVIFLSFCPTTARVSGRLLNQWNMNKTPDEGLVPP